MYDSYAWAQNAECGLCHAANVKLLKSGVIPIAFIFEWGSARRCIWCGGVAASPCARACVCAAHMLMARSVVSRHSARGSRSTERASQRETIAHIHTQHTHARVVVFVFVIAGVALLLLSRNEREFSTFAFHCEFATAADDNQNTVCTVRNMYNNERRRFERSHN